MEALAPDAFPLKERIYILKPGELALKGGNRRSFERALRHNLKALLAGSGAVINRTNGRLLVKCPAEAAPLVEDALAHLTGISGWARTRVCDKTVEAVMEACVDCAGECTHEHAGAGAGTFKLEARRTDKSFPLDSYGIRSLGGERVLAAYPNLKVQLKKPELVIEVEIRERAYVYGLEHKGLRGLPAGTAGRGLLLLSGGIDSPVAGQLMICRGMAIDGVYFHAYPYTSDEARQKVLRLAEIIGRYCLGMRLYTIGFTAVQMRIKERAPLEWTTVLLRMAMMAAAETLARQRRLQCLITGESLSQVASQTIENITCTQSRVSLPVMRPLIGLDKEGITRMAESIGSYETSILPFQDCCALFSPPHPILRGNAAEAGELYEKLELGELIATALGEARQDQCGYPERNPVHVSTLPPLK
ncbi:MAG: tRNA 4-thiouridine(8) synthase ThiI [Treponema sp.]|jgi:thiamine biosynthesis protein ThiI|nr:tRNA 4-thiouridine(8) synthase ThiI [Treponema sp.]